VKYQDKSGLSNFDNCEGLQDEIKGLYSKQETIEDIQSFTLYMYSLIGSLSIEYLIRKGIEIKKVERNED